MTENKAIVLENGFIIDIPEELIRYLEKNKIQWNWRYWLNRLQQQCEENRVSFRSVSPYNTSITCSDCGHADRMNRLSQECFVCQSCGHTDNADINASRNILSRFILGKYGSQCKQEKKDEGMDSCLNLSNFK